MGIRGLPFPEEYAGSGGDWVGEHVCIEEISRGDLILVSLLDVTTSAAGQEIDAFGTEKQKKNWLMSIAPVYKDRLRVRKIFFSSS